MTSVCSSTNWRYSCSLCCNACFGC
ncbi:hypothetical protein [Nostoc sp. PCC 7120 = FACHB-418]